METHIPRATVAFSLRRVMGLIGVATGVCALIIGWAAVDTSVHEEREAMLHTLMVRAQSLVWAVEGASSLPQVPMADALRQLSQQPGIAYVTIIDRSGHIVQDNNPELIGQLFYTPSELQALSPQGQLKGRFVPDNENIFESWQIFRPERRHGHRPREPLYIFIGLDAANFQTELNNYQWRLTLYLVLISMLVLSCVGLIYFAASFRRSRRLLDDTQALAEQIMASYPSPLLVTDLSGKIKFANQDAKKFLDLNGARQNLDNIAGVDWAQAQRELEHGLAVSEQERPCRLPSGQLCPVAFSDAIVRDSHGTPLGWLFVLRNLAPMKELEKRLAESSRLAALGHLAAGVAHEIRNPLSSIRGYASYLRQRVEKDALAGQTAALLEEEAIRLDHALSDLLLLTKKPSLRPRPTDMGAVLKKLELLLAPDIAHKRIHLHLALPSSAPILTIDAERLLQALLNIALNAIQAVDNGGTIAISLNHTPPTWCISIRDNGHGIDEERQQQIFTPYFTTRASGTGLGLTLSRQIVEAHGGKILVSSTPGEGAIFSICLPEEPPCHASL